MKWMLLRLIQLYQQTISPFLGPHCRFFPSCSQYAYTAIEQAGCIRGSFLALKRIAKCHPFHEGGCDPVPQERSRHG